jgi:hypothetical protein
MRGVVAAVRRLAVCRVAALARGLAPAHRQIAGDGLAQVEARPIAANIAKLPELSHKS